MRTSKEKPAAGAAAPGGNKPKAEASEPEAEAGKKPVPAADPEKDPAEGEGESEGEGEGEAGKAALSAATEAARAAGHAAGRAEAMAEAQAVAETCELAGQSAGQVARLLKAGKTGAAAREEILKARDASIAGQPKITGQHDAGLTPVGGAAAWEDVIAKTNARHGFKPKA